MTFTTRELTIHSFKTPEIVAHMNVSDKRNLERLAEADLDIVLCLSTLLTSLLQHVP